MSFLDNFQSIWFAVANIFIVIFVAWTATRLELLPQRLGKDLSQLVIRLLLPCLVFSKLTGKFNPESYPLWWLPPLIAIFLSLAGMGFAALLFFNELKTKKNLLPLAGMQNSGFLVLSIGVVLYPNSFDLFANQVFLFLIGFDLILWSLAKYLATSGNGTRFRFRDVFTPPLVTILFSLTLVFTGLATYVPEIFITSANFLGQATVPMSMVILGISLANISFGLWPPLRDSIKINSVKYLLLPVLTFILLWLTGLAHSNPLLAELLVIESCSAPAITIMIQVCHYGGDQQKIGSLMVISYTLALFFIPFWLALWRVVS